MEEVFHEGFVLELFKSERGFSFHFEREIVFVPFGADVLFVRGQVFEAGVSASAAFFGA